MTDDVTTLRQAAERLRGLRDVDMERLALASRFEATANALAANVAVVQPELVVRVARVVLAQHEKDGGK